MSVESNQDKRRPAVAVNRLVRNFDEFWGRINEQWKLLTIQERNFRKAIGLAPDKAVAMQAWRVLNSLPPKQLNLFPNKELTD